MPAPTVLQGQDAYTPPTGLTPTKTAQGGSAFSDASGNIYVQSSPGQYTLLNQVNAANTAPQPTSASAATTSPAPSVITPAVAQTKISDIKSQLDQITAAVAARKAASATPIAPTGTGTIGGTNGTLAPATSSTSGNFYYTVSQDAQGNKQYTYYDSNGNTLATNPIGGSQYQNNPEATPNAQGRLIQLPNAPTEGGFTNTPLSTDQYNAALLGQTQSYQKQLADLNTASDAAYSDYQSKLNNILNGNFPLTPSQQAIVDATNAQFQSLRAQQQKANDAYVSGMKVFEARSGELQGGQETAMGNVQSAINTGIQKLNDLDAKAALTLADLQNGFAENNLKTIQSSYQEWTQYASQKEKALKDMHDEVSQSVKDLRDFVTAQAQRNIDNIIKTSQLNLEQGKFDWQKTQDQIKNQIDLQNLGINERKQALAEAQFKLQKDMWGRIESSPAAPMTNGAPDPVAQEKILAQYPQGIQTLIKGVSDYSIDPHSLSTSAKQAMGGMTQAALLAAVKQYDPSYDEKQYSARQKFLTNWTSGGQNSVIQAANTSIDHLARLWDQAQKLGNAPSGYLGPFTGSGNNINAWLKQGSQDPNIFQFKQTAIALAGEMARIYKNGTGSSAAPTDDEIAQQLDVLSAGLSPDNAKGLIQNGINLMTDRLTSATENYQSVIGKIPPSILYNTALDQINTLRKDGFEINTNSLNPSQFTGVSNDSLIQSLSGASSSKSPAVDPTTFFNLFNMSNSMVSQ